MKAKKRTPKLLRLLENLWACEEKCAVYSGMTLEAAWRKAGFEDRLWLVAMWEGVKGDGCRIRGCVICEPLKGLPKITARSPLPAGWIKRWGGYEESSVAKGAGK